MSNRDLITSLSFDGDFEQAGYLTEPVYEPMNEFITAIKALDLAAVTVTVKKDSKWPAWTEPSGKQP